jgi:hypothetical protein
MPRSPVKRKLAEVFVTVAFVVEGEAVRARVNRAHMVILERRLRVKKSYWKVRNILCF